MVCAFGFQELASRNEFIKCLEEQGYLLDFVDGCLFIYGLPYIDKQGELAYGDWASPLDVSKDGVIDPPSDHQAWFRGERPHDQNGRMLRLGGGPQKQKLAVGFESDHRFSFKLQDDRGLNRIYNSFEEKASTYLDVITGPALAAFPDATPLKAIEALAKEQGTPLKFPDTMSSRYQMNDISRKLDGLKVAIVGLGGTGSYILDYIARTHLAEISLFDDDKVHLHTIFRYPGFIQNAIGKLKIEALTQQYGIWHDNIVPRVNADQ